MNDTSHFENNLENIPLQDNNVLNNQFDNFNQNSNNFSESNSGEVTQNISNDVDQISSVVNNTSFSLGQTTNTNYIDTIKKGDESTNTNGFEDVLASELQITDNSNQFIHNNLNYNETSLNDLNVDGSYNQMLKPDYSNDPKVIENLQGPKKNTVTITKELKTFFLIAIVLLIFIFVMPYIFDTLRNANINK